ncbi:MAG: hypothetical protein ABIT76_12405 [Chthoniobacterales bacterium]
MKRKLQIALLSVSLQSASAFNIAIDYSNDSTNFFDNLTARATLEKAAADLSAAITSSLAPVTTDVYTGTNGSTTSTFDWDLTYTNPTTGAAVTLDTFTAAANTFTIYVGARPISGTALGQGGIGAAGFSFGGSGSGSQWTGAVAAAEAASNAGMGRGSNVTFNSASDSATLGSSTANYNVRTGPMIGNMWFDNDSNNDGSIDDTVMLGNYWNFDYANNSFAGKNDFYSVALHEIIHSIGFSGSESWDGEHSGTTWLGSSAVALNGGTGSGLLASDEAHIVSGYSSTRLDTGAVQEAVMDPSLTQGTRKYLTQMDLAMLHDMGYQVVPEVNTSALLAVGLGGLLWFRRKAVAR